MNMKTRTKFLAVPAALLLLTGFTASIQSAEPPKHRELTVWISNPTGSLLGRGYASSYLTNIPARTLSRDGARLRNAVHGLDGLGMMPVKGFGLVPAAVAWQTSVPMRKLIEQQAETGLSYGELLVANSIASQSQQSFSQVVALRAQTRSWGELARQLNVDPALLVTRAKTASQRIRNVDNWTRRRHLKEGGTNYTSVNPHIQRSRLF